MPDYEMTALDGSPVECFYFEYLGIIYTYTSADTAIKYSLNGTTYTFNPEYIKRGDTLKVGGSDSEACSINVKRTNPIAMLFQGSPPEATVQVRVGRIHLADTSKLDIIICGNVSQCTFDGSEAELTITVENYMNKEIPRGKLQYYCNNFLFDKNCMLNEDNYKITCYVDLGITSLSIRSSDLKAKPDGYFNNGVVVIGNSIRTVTSHIGDTIYLKYPINTESMLGSFTIVPGCDGIFRTCAVKYSNTLNFTGVPYTKPASDDISKGAVCYWIDSVAIKRDTNGLTGIISL